MKKLLLLFVVLFLGYSFYQKHAERRREQLVGVWSMERDLRGGWGKMFLHLKPDGTATVDVSATVQGHVASREGFGTWKSSHSILSITFDRGDVLPLLKPGGFYGGPLLALDDKTLSYRCKEGVETWRRAP